MLGVGGKRVHVAPLSLGIERIESQRGFAAAGKARHHDELPARDVHADALEVVGPGAADFDILLRLHGLDDADLEDGFLDGAFPDHRGMGGLGAEDDLLARLGGEPGRRGILI